MKKFRIPFFEQSEQSECGLCCIAMIMAYYGCSYDICELRSEYSLGRDGTNLLLLKNIAEKNGFMCKGFRINSINDISFPAILNEENKHFVVAEKRVKNSVIIIDPKKGRYRLDEDEFFEKNIHIGLEIKTSDKVKKRKSSFSLISYVQFMDGSFAISICALLLTVLMQLLALIPPISANYFIDNYVAQGNINISEKILIYIFLLLLSYFSLGTIKSFLITELQQVFNGNLSGKLVKKILSLPNVYFQNRGTGDVVHRYTGIVVVREMLSFRIIDIWLNLGLVIIYDVYMFTISPTIAVLMNIAALLIIAISILNIIGGQELIAKEVIEEGNTTSFFNELVQAITVIKMKGCEKEVYNKWNHCFRKQMMAMKKKGRFMAFTSSALAAMQFIIPLLLLFVALRLTSVGSISVGTVFSIYIVSQGFYSPIVSGISIINEILYANAYFKRINEVFQTSSEKHLEDGISNFKLTGRIEVKNVGFRYNKQGKEILKNISFDVYPGEFVAIVGETASGKSTMISLLSGMEELTQGEIFYDGYSIKNLNLRELRKKIGIVSQNNYLFSESIEENLLLGLNIKNKNDMIEACVKAAVYNDIQNMPMQFATVLSENAQNISGGQRQRIAFARAIINKPTILILDEATSALDNLTEKEIQENLNEMKCTRIVIAHRLSTIEKADKILVMKNGKIIAQGTHLELLDRCDIYKTLYTKRKGYKF